MTRRGELGGAGSKEDLCMLQDMAHRPAMIKMCVTGVVRAIRNTELVVRHVCAYLGITVSILSALNPVRRLILSVSYSRGPIILLFIYIFSAMKSG